MGWKNQKCKKKANRDFLSNLLPETRDFCLAVTWNRMAQGSGLSHLMFWPQNKIADGTTVS